MFVYYFSGKTKYNDVSSYGWHDETPMFAMIWLSLKTM